MHMIILNAEIITFVWILKTMFKKKKKGRDWKVEDVKKSTG